LRTNDVFASAAFRTLQGSSNERKPAEAGPASIGLGEIGYGTNTYKSGVTSTVVGKIE
jgi:hypothetical protein